MLCSLNIRDLTIVKSLDLDFKPGLTVLTGETGAGKSILLTAMGLALGDRAESGLIRPGCEKAEINLEFDVSDAPVALAWLKELELDDQSNCLIRRVLNQEGRSKAFINNRPVTLQSLQELAERLIEIHGQHAHLSLLKPTEQRRILDETSNNHELLDRLNNTFTEWHAIRTELAGKIETTGRKTERDELLRYQINELETAEVESLNYEELTVQHTRQANAETIALTTQAQINFLYDDEQHSVNSKLNDSIKALTEISQHAPEMNSVVQLLNEAQIQVQESSQILRRQLDEVEIDPNHLAYLDDKLALIHTLARKHQVTPNELIDKLNELRQELKSLEQADEQIKELETQLGETTHRYNSEATQISKIRKKAAQVLQDQISNTIKDLGMPQGKFSIQVERYGENENPKPNGLDRVEFLVSTNPGMPARPLNKVASGGELSRISLAIQVGVLDSNSAPTMIFDEVDAGIGGGVAETVGQKLRTLGSKQQVLCVTHLAQVAAQSHHHLLVEKSNDKANTESRVHQLSPELRKQEIARMLGGLNITDQTLAHAQEMLELANQSKNDVVS